MKGTETPYTSKEIVARLEIGESTLRKWCLALEEQSYSFIRTDQNKRMFTEKDAYVLNQFKHLVKDKNLSINNAAAIVSAKYVNEVFSNETEIEQANIEVPLPPFSNETLGELMQGIEQMKAEVEQMKDLNRMLLTRLDEQQKYIDGRLNVMESRQNERDNTLLESLRTSQETKQLLLEAKEAEQQKKPRKGLLKWFVRE
jgi:DNA-binding transcriptional MerR regulator